MAAHSPSLNIRDLFAAKAAAAARRRAFEAGERELMLVKFPSVLCEDGGRRIDNPLDGGQDTPPGVMHKIYEWWEKDLAPGGFTFSARVIDYPGGMPGDVGIVIGWPESLDWASGAGAGIRRLGFSRRALVHWRPRMSWARSRCALPARCRASRRRVSA